MINKERINEWLVGSLVELAIKKAKRSLYLQYPWQEWKYTFASADRAFGKLEITFRINNKKDNYDMQVSRNFQLEQLLLPDNSPLYGLGHINPGRGGQE